MLYDVEHMTEVCVQKARTQLARVSIELTPGDIPLFSRAKRFGIVDQMGTLGK